jgi:tetratricopeptide (TPR) repeat protein
MEVVLLYEPDERSKAEIIKAALAVHYDVWTSEDVQVGDQPVREISKHLAYGGPIVICGTMRLAGSKWLAGLVAAVQGSDLRGLERLFPVRLELGANLEAHMHGAKIAEGAPSLESGIRELTKAILSRFPPSSGDALGTTAESDAELRVTNFTSWLSPCRGFSKEHLRLYREHLRPEDREKLSDALDDVTFLERAQLAKNGFLYGAGILLFTERPTDHALTAYVQCVRFRGRDRSAAQENKVLDGPVAAQMTGAMEFIESRIEKSEILKPGDMDSKPIYQYPMICLREVLANAICHRDYADQKRHVYVRLYEDRIEIANPGPWVAQPLESGKEILLQDLRSEPASRNERLAAALRRSGFVETQGSGIPSAINDCMEQGADIPKVKYETEMIVVTIFPKRDWSTLSIQRREHILPFEKLAPGEFERLCLWLVEREGYSQIEQLGEVGSEGGRDVVAWKNGRRFVFQCKRAQAFNVSQAGKEIEKLRRLPLADQPHELVFVVARAVSADTRSAIREVWGDQATCHFWSGNELDQRVKSHPDLLEEFFQLPSVRTRTTLPRNLPFSSLGPLFQGREEMITILREKLTQTPAGRATAIAGKAVHGLGGVGKTRLAVEYAWRYAADYTALLFVGAGSPDDLRRNLAALSDRNVLDLPEQDAPEEEVREAAVLRWLGEHSRWLLILDNVDSEEAAAAVEGLVARLHGGQVLLTGRLARWSTEVEPLELDALTEEAAAGFLLARTKTRRRTTPEDAELAVALARELGFLPLALEQAGAYIAERRLTLAAYLEEWHSRHEQVLMWFDPRVSHYPASVAAIWQTSVERLSAPARRMLERLAWLGPEPIPESLLDVPLPDSPEEPDHRDALVELETYSLVTRDSESPAFTVHRLVQDVTRRSLRNGPGDGLTTEILGEALRWVNAAFVGDPQDVRAWPTLDRLASHARAVIMYADAAGIADPTARLMNQLAQLLYAKSLLGEAEPLMRRALAIEEKSFGAKNPNVAIRLNNLAQLLQATNRLSEAEPLMRRVVAIFESSFGEDHPNVAAALNNLALLLKATNRLSEAEPLMRRALAIDEKSFGTEHPKVALRLNNLASLLQATNRLSEAEPLMRRALAIDEKSFGAEHPKVAIRLNNLASLLQATNRLSEAEPLMRRVVTIFESSLGEGHPNVAAAFNNLAQLFQVTNRLSEAEPLIRRALAIDEESFGADHPNIARDLNNLARLLQSTNRLGEAEPLMRRALAIDEKSFGAEHPDVATDLNNLAQLLRATNRLGEAEPLMRRNLIIFLDFTRRTGHEHPYLRDALGNYRDLLQEMGKSDTEIEATIAALVRSPE